MNFKTHNDKSVIFQMNGALIGFIDITYKELKKHIR